MMWFLLLKVLFGCKCSQTNPTNHREEDEVYDDGLELGDLGDVDSQTDENAIEIPMKRPIAYALISIWGLSETVLLIILFMTSIHEPKPTFMKGLCTIAEEPVTKKYKYMIIYKIVTSTLLFIGGRSVSKN